MGSSYSHGEAAAVYTPCAVRIFCDERHVSAKCDRSSPFAGELKQLVMYADLRKKPNGLTKPKRTVHRKIRKAHGI